MMLVILWLIQDLLTVFTGGGMQIPGLFMLGVVFRLLFSDNNNDDGNLWAIWSAFAGGILWDTRIFHARLCRCSLDCDTGLGNYSSSRQGIRFKPLSVLPPRMLAINPANVTRSDFRRQYWMGIFPHATSLFFTRYSPHYVHLPSESKG